MTDMQDNHAFSRGLRLTLLGLAGLSSALVGNGCSALLDFEQCTVDTDCSVFGDGFVCNAGSCVTDGLGSGESGDGDGDASGDGDGEASGDGDGDPSGDGDGDPSGDGDGDPSGDGDGDPSGDGDGDPSGDGDGDGGAIVDMIDDFEDGNGALLPNDGRQGFWYVFNDGSMGGSQTPPADRVLPSVGGANDTDHAMHSTGNGFTVWGAGLGVDFQNMGGNSLKMPYDASNYTGIVLMGKGNGPVRVSVAIESTTAESEGGTCVSDCDQHGLLLNFTNEWQEFYLPFDELAQEGWGTPQPWDAATTTALQFKLNPNIDFDLWVDEIGFY